MIVPWKDFGRFKDKSRVAGPSTHGRRGVGRSGVRALLGAPRAGAGASVGMGWVIGYGHNRLLHSAGGALDRGTVYGHVSTADRLEDNSRARRPRTPSRSLSRTSAYLCNYDVHCVCVV